MPMDQSDISSSRDILLILLIKVFVFASDSVANVNSMPKRKDLLNPPSNADFYGLSRSRSLSRSSSNGVGLAVGSPQQIPVLSLVTGKAAMAGKNAFLQVDDNPSISNVLRKKKAFDCRLEGFCLQKGPRKNINVLFCFLVHKSQKTSVYGWCCFKPSSCSSFKSVYNQWQRASDANSQSFPTRQEVSL